MDSDVLKIAFKEIIKESLREILQEEGVLAVLAENKKTVSKPAPKIVGQLNKGAVQETNEKHKKLAESVTKSRFTAQGFNPFEGTTPLKESQATDGVSKTGPLKDVDPDDPGVDVSSLLSENKQLWKTLVHGKKK